MITHISFSSILLFLHNKSAWRAKYLLGIRDQQTNPAALTGSAFHKYMELRLKGHPKELAENEAQNLVRTVEDVDWGKTGSMEGCLKDLDKLIATVDKEWVWNKNTLAVELGIMERIKGFKVPLNAYIDYLYEENGEVVIVDWKTVRSYADELKPVHIFQGVYYYLAVLAAFGRKPVRFDIVQIKASQNKDGSPQMKTLSLDYKKHPEYLKAVRKITKDALKEMFKKTTTYLPNLRDEYEGEKEWKRYIEQL